MVMREMSGLNIPISKAPVSCRRRFGRDFVVAENICDQFILDYLLHHSPHKPRARDTALFCSCLEVLNFQRDDNVLDGHSQVLNAPLLLVRRGDRES
jgi:hypothetical protein